MALRQFFSRSVKSRLFRHGSAIFRGVRHGDRFRSFFRGSRLHLGESAALKYLVFTNEHAPEVVVSEFKSTSKFGGGTDFFRGTRDAVLILARILLITSVVSALIVAYLVSRLRHDETFPSTLRKAVEFLGPTFTKFGQWISTRKDLFPEHVCDTFSRLQRNAPPHSWTYTKHLLRATYGPSWRELFVKFEDETPIGSGCCAQVYKAWIDPDARVEMTREPRISRFVEIVEYFGMGRLLNLFGRVLPDREELTSDGRTARKLQPVAVKVLHPGIKGQLKRDVTILRGICKCATYLIPDLHWLSLTDCIDEFSRVMENQVDMRLEANNLLRFSRNFSTKEEVVFPHAYTNLTHRGVLVESFHDGSPISDYLDCNDAVLQHKLAKIGIATILKMIFKDNFIHCDLHPGNILVVEEKTSEPGFLAWILKLVAPNSTGRNPRLIILDCGLVFSLDSRCRQNLCDVFRCVLMGNGELAAEYILEHSSRMTPDPEGFKLDLGNIVRTHLRKRLDLANVNVSTVVAELLSAMVRHRVKQDGSFGGVILSMAVIEGLGRSLDPNIDIFSEVLPFLFPSAVHGNTE